LFEDNLDEKAKKQVEELKKSAAIAGLLFFAIMATVYLIFR